MSVCVHVCVCALVCVFVSVCVCVCVCVRVLVRVYVAECYMHLFIYFSLIFTVLTKSIVTCIYLLCPCVQGSMQLKSLSMFVSIHWSLCATSCFKSYLTKTYKYSHPCAQKVVLKSLLHRLWRRQEPL